MKNILVRVLKTIEKVIVAMCIMTALGLVSGDNFSLEAFRKIMLFGVLMGGVIGISSLLIDMDKLNGKIAYVLHFIIGYISLNILEGLIFNGTILPQSPPINYLFKFISFLVLYIIVVTIEIISEKNASKKMVEKIKELKQES